MARMHIKSLVCGIGIFLAAVSTATESYANLGQEVHTYGNWTVRRSVDAMTDAVSCLATYRDNIGAQLYADSLYISVRGPKGFQYRLDDASPSDLQLVSDILQRVGAISFERTEFQRVLAADRLRVQVVTYFGVENFDLDLTGIRPANEFITTSGKCR